MTVATTTARVLSRSPSSPSPGHGPTPPEGGTYYHWWRDPDPHPYYTQRGIFNLEVYLSIQWELVSYKESQKAKINSE
ncbi:hypothetical protein AVEN_94022-1, partial [Araneus ventricosus]